MKLNHYQLENFLAKNLSANHAAGKIFLLSGDEILLIQESVDLIRNAARKINFNERVSITLEAGQDWGKLFFAETQSLSLFSSKRIVELHLGSAKPNAANVKIFQEIAANPPADTIVIITVNKLDKKTELAAWYKAIDKVGICIPLWPIASDQLPGWIVQRAKKIGLQMTADAAKLLAREVEGNLLAASQEIEKLALLQVNKVIDVDLIATTVTDNARFDIYSLVDCALSGDAKRSLHMLNNLEAEDAEPVLILWALTREIRTLADLASQLQKGESLGMLFSKYRIWEKRQPAVRHFLQKKKAQDCRRLLSQSAAVDKVIKGAAKGNKWLALQGLVMQMAMV